ncbi:MAG: lauroyl acyltransferase [Desulfobulbus sp.]
MSWDGYTLLARTARLIGPWIFVAVSRTLAVGYFLFSSRRRESVRLYARLFPSESMGWAWWRTFLQYQQFTTIHYDRFLYNLGKQTRLTSSGDELLEGRMPQTGAILLMSHLGNWEIAARLLMENRRNLQLLLYMGIKEQEGVERTQKEELQQAGVKIIGVDRKSNVPFSAVEGIQVLRAGGLVSMAGDIVWRQDQRCLTVRFLNQQAVLPEAPFVFALVSGAPILAFFAFRVGKNHYRITLSEPIFVRADTKEDRHKVLLGAAQRYADLLEEALRSHPSEWYHFDRFFHDH